MDKTSPPARSRTAPAASDASLWQHLQPLVLDIVAVQSGIRTRHRLAFGQSMFMRYLLLHGPTRVSCLARWSGISRSAATELVDGLERHGWVRRARERTDRRGIRVSLTPRGGVKIGQIEAEAKQILDRAGRRLTVEEARTIGQSLQSLHAALREEGPRPVHRPEVAPR